MKCRKKKVHLPLVSFYVLKTNQKELINILHFNGLSIILTNLWKQAVIKDYKFENSSGGNLIYQLYQGLILKKVF